MPRYRLSGFVIQSSVGLPELPRATGTPSYVFTLSARARDARPLHWFHHWQASGNRRWLSFARTPAGYLLRFPRLADFEVLRERRGTFSRIRARPRRALPIETARHLFLDQVWPLVLSGGGRLVIHASAVVLPDGRAVAFAGPAGAGKSSLAAAMISAGCRLVTDDCLLLEPRGGRWRAVPSYPGLRLWPDMLARFAGGGRGGTGVAHYTSKRRLAGAMPFARRAAPLAAMYLVRRRAAGAKVAVTPLAGAAALMELVPFTYLLDFGAREALARSFAELAALTTAVPILGLDVPHAPRRLGEVTALLMQPAGGC